MCDYVSEVWPFEVTLPVSSRSVPALAGTGLISRGDHRPISNCYRIPLDYEISETTAQKKLQWECSVEDLVNIVELPPLFPEPNNVAI